MKVIDHRQAHSGVLLPNGLQTSGWTDGNTLHAEIAGDFLDRNKRGTGMHAGPNIKHIDGTIRADFDTPAAANASGGKNFFADRAGWSQPVGSNRRLQ